MINPNLPLDVREISVGEDDIFAFGTFDDHPDQIGFICEKEVDGVRQRRCIFFPYDAREAAALAQGLMEIAGVQQISIRKKGGAHVTFGPTCAQKVWKTMKEKGEV